jgi:hypothetical protein
MIEDEVFCFFYYFCKKSCINVLIVNYMLKNANLVIVINIVTFVVVENDGILFL